MGNLHDHALPIFGSQIYLLSYQVIFILNICVSHNNNNFFGGVNYEIFDLIN